MFRFSTFLLLACCSSLAFGQLACRSPFRSVGGRCLYVAAFLQAEWDAARFFCSEIQADLVIVDSAQFYMDILEYLSVNNIDQRSYWLAGTDKIIDGTWTWINGEPMPLGSPYWAVEGIGSGDYLVEPSDNGKDNHDCVSMDGVRALFWDDTDCNTLIAAICEPV